MNNNLRLVLYLLFFCLIKTIHCQATENEYCLPPWEKLNDDICLLLNSEIKTWQHSKQFCAFQNSDLLYINDSNEQKLISGFFGSLMRYRFNFRPSVWLDAVKNGTWKWSHNNQTILFNNWQNLMTKRNSYNCGSMRVKTGDWQNSDCLSTAHYVCRKQKPNTIDNPTVGRFLNNVNLIEPTNKLVNNILTKSQIESEENLMVKNKPFRITKSRSSNQKVMLEGEAVATGVEQINHESDSNSKLIVPHIAKQLEETKQSTNFIRDSSLFINIFRTKIPKKSMLFLIYECPYGFGYYSTNTNGCNRYKICENWDSQYAVLSLNQCVDGKIFNFKSFLCVDAETNECDARKFVPI